MTSVDPIVPPITNYDLRAARLRQIDAETRGLELKNQIYQEEVNDRFLTFQQHGIYQFYTPVVTQTVTKALYELDSMSRRRPEQPITVVFNSPGGVVTDGFTLYDFLRELSRSGHHITTKCMGAAASMGAILMQAGDTRVMTPNSFMMVHEISGQNEGTIAEMKDTLAIVERFQDKAINILTARSNMSKRALKVAWKKTDWYMDADEALAKGFIDAIEE
jgi:ATP-dependent Clp endopeptidase proteolytic subunit ClpP